MERRRVIHPPSTTGVSPVVQDGVKDSSIAHMVRQIDRMPGRTLPQGSRQPMFGDFTHPAWNDFHARMQTLTDARNAFLALPIEVREAFHHSPEALSAALVSEDPKVQDHLVALGLRHKLVKEPPKPAEPKPAEKPAEPAE